MPKGKTIQELKEDRMHAARSAQDILERAKSEGRDMTAEEVAASENYLADVDKIENQIEEARKLQEIEDRITSKSEAVRKSDGAVVPPMKPGTLPTEKPEIEFPRSRYGALKAFKTEEAAYRMGQWVRAACMKDRRAERWCINNGVESRALSEGTNTAGGYLVPEEMTQAIIDLREEYGTFRRFARVIPMGRDVMTVPRRTGGVTASFYGEGGTIASSDPTWGQVQLSAKKMGVLTLMSSELAEDAMINLADTIASEFAYAFALKEDQCGWLGDGTSTYAGIQGVCVLGDDASHTAGKVAAASGHDTLAEIDTADLANLMGKCPAYARLGAAWYCSQTAADVVFGRLMAAGGGNTTQTLTGAIGPSYLGYPIRVSQVLFSTTTASNGSWALGFGNLAMAATLGDRRGINVATSNDVYFTTDQVALRATQRLDIVVHDLGDTTNAGPFVCLELTT